MGGVPERLSPTREPFRFIEHRTAPGSHTGRTCKLTATIRENGQERLISGKGNGPIDAFTDALNRHCGLDLRVVDYHEHAIGPGLTRLLCPMSKFGWTVSQLRFGVGIDGNIVTASLNAVISAVNRALRQADSDRKRKLSQCDGWREPEKLG